MISVIGVSNTKYYHEELSVSGQIIIIGNKKNKMVSPVYWKSGVIRKVCTSPKAAKTGGVIKEVDDAVNTAQQRGTLMNSTI